MRINFSENAITAKVRALYGQRITRSQYEELARKRSTSEIAAYLKERTHLAGVLAQVQPATVRSDQLETVLRRARYYKYLSLRNYASPKDRDFYDQYVLRVIEIEQILQMIRLINIGRTREFISGYPAFADSGLQISLDRLARVKTYDDLLTALEGTDYHDPLLHYRITDKSQPIVDYAHCEMTLMNCYYTAMKKVVARSFTGKARQEIEDIMATKIALENLIIGYRMKKYYPQMSPEEIRSYLLDFWREPPKRQVEALLNAPDAERYLELLRSTRIARGLPEEEIGSIGFGSQSIRNLLSERYMRRTQNPATAFVSHMFLSEMEIENIVRLVEAVRYGMEPAEILNLLVIL